MSPLREEKFYTLVLVGILSRGEECYPYFISLLEIIMVFFKFSESPRRCMSSSECYCVPFFAYGGEEQYLFVLFD